MVFIVINIGDKVKVEGQDFIAEVVGRLGLEEVQIKLPDTGQVIWKDIEDLERCGNND